MKQEELIVAERIDGKDVEIGRITVWNPEDFQGIVDGIEEKYWDMGYVTKCFWYGHCVSSRSAFKNRMKPKSLGISSDTKALIRDGIKSGSFTDADLAEFIASRKRN